MVITGFHAIQEQLRSGAGTADGGRPTLLYDTAGPRIKKIIADGKKRGIHATQMSKQELDRICADLPEVSRDHRGLVLAIDGLPDEAVKRTAIDIQTFIASCIKEGHTRKTVVMLDSITDPHNVGAIIRSCDQFAVDLVVLCTHGSILDSSIIDRSSAGASAWVPVSRVSNLVRTADLFIEAGFWIYGADAGGESVENVSRSDKALIIMGSEGSGISRLLREKCDSIVSIPTQGKLDSLNVSVAAGILLYEFS